MVKVKHTSKERIDRIEKILSKLGEGDPLSDKCERLEAQIGLEIVKEYKKEFKPHLKAVLKRSPAGVS